MLPSTVAPDKPAPTPPVDPTPPRDPLAGIPGRCSIEVDATLVRSSYKALLVRLPDNRELWIPKSVGLMAERFKKPGTRAPAGLRPSQSDLKSVVIIPVWFWRKVKDAA